jgi:hypothetical protein
MLKQRSRALIARRLQRKQTSYLFTAHLITYNDAQPRADLLD